MLQLLSSSLRPTLWLIGVINALSHAKQPPTNIHPQEAKAVKELAGDGDIVLLAADKGRATVVMDCKDYSPKMLMMLGDRDTYQPMAKDPTRGDSLIWSL